MNRPLAVTAVLIGAQIAFAASIGLGGMIGLKPAVALASTSTDAPEWVLTPMCASSDPIVLPCNWVDDSGTLVHFTRTVCAYEDGNVDGLPCVWIDPDTGNAYFVTSENYRNGQP